MKFKESIVSFKTKLIHEPLDHIVEDECANQIQPFAEYSAPKALKFTVIYGYTVNFGVNIKSSCLYNFPTYPLPSLPFFSVPVYPGQNPTEIRGGQTQLRRMLT